MVDSQTGISGVGDNYEDEFFSLNGFKKNHFDERIIDSYFSEIKTVASIENTPFEFMFTVPDDCFLEQSETLLEGEFKVLKGDETNVTDTDVISLCNMPSAAIFEQIECKINDENCSDVSRKLYPFKAHVCSELSYSKGAKTSVLRPSLYLYEPNTADSNDAVIIQYAKVLFDTILFYKKLSRNLIIFKSTQTQNFFCLLYIILNNVCFIKNRSNTVVYYHYVYYDFFMKQTLLLQYTGSESFSVLQNELFYLLKYLSYLISYRRD